MRVPSTRLLLPVLGGLILGQPCCNRTSPPPAPPPAPAEKQAPPPQAEPAGPSRPIADLKGPVELLGHDGGAVLLSSWPGESGKTELDFRRLDAHGSPIGNVQVLRTMPGALKQVSATAIRAGDEDQLAVAWCSETDKGAQLFGMAWLSSKGAIKGKPVELGLEDHAGCIFTLLPYEESVLIVRATTKKERRCVGSADRREGSELNNYPCPTHVLQRVTTAGSLSQIADFKVDPRRKAEAGEAAGAEGFSGPFSAVRTDRSVLFMTNLPETIHGPALNLILLPGAGEPGFDTPEWQARFEHVFWTPEGVLITGQTVGRGGKSAKEAQGLHATQWLANKFGGDVNDRDEYHNQLWPRITERHLSCEGRHLRCTLTGEKKFQAELDPASPASSFRLADMASTCGEGTEYEAAAWTGEALLTWDRASGLGVHPCQGGAVRSSPTSATGP